MKSFEQVAVIIVVSFFLRGCDLMSDSAFCIAPEPYTILTITHYLSEEDGISTVFKTDFSDEPTNIDFFYIEEYEFATDRSVLIHPKRYSSYKTFWYGAYPELLSNYQTIIESLPNLNRLESLDMRLSQKDAAYTTKEHVNVQHPSIDDLNIKIDHRILSYQNIERKSIDTLYLERSGFTGDYSYLKSSVYNALLGEGHIYALLSNEYFSADSSHVYIGPDSFTKSYELNLLVRLSLSNQKLDTVLVLETGLASDFQFKITKDYILGFTNNLVSIYSLEGSLIHEIGSVGEVNVNFAANDFTYKSNGKFYHFDIDHRRRYSLSRYSDNINSVFPGNNRVAIISYKSQKIVVADLEEERILDTYQISQFINNQNDELQHNFLYPVFDEMNTLNFMIYEHGLVGGSCSE